MPLPVQEVVNRVRAEMRNMVKGGRASCTYTLNRLLYDYEEALGEIIALGLPELLFQVIKNPKTPKADYSTALVCVGNCCFGKPTELEKFENILSVARTPGLIPHLVKIVTTADTRDEAAKGLSPISNMASGINITEAEGRGREIGLMMKAAGVPGALLPHTIYETRTGVNAMRSLANIVGSEELKKGSQSFMHLGPTKVMVDVQTHMLDGEFQYMNTTWTKNTMVQPLSLMAISDSNKPLLVEAGAIPVLCRTVAEWKWPSSVGYCIAALLELSFLHEKDEDLIESNLFPASIKATLAAIVSGKELKDLPTAAKMSAARLLGRLDPTKQKQRRKSVLELIPAAPADGSTKHVMMSYCWNNKAGCKALTEQLKANGVTTWRDEEGSPLVPSMSGATDEIMAAAIEKSDTVVVCVCRGYKKSANCRFEAKYAQQRLKRGQLKIIYVMMEQDYTTVSADGVDGWLAFMISDALWYPGWDIANMAGAAKEIASLIGPEAKGGGSTAAPSSPTAGPAPSPAVAAAPLPASQAEICKMTVADVAVWLDANSLGALKAVFAAEQMGGRAVLMLQEMARKSAPAFMDFQLKSALSKGISQGALLSLCHVLCHEGLQAPQ